METLQVIVDEARKKHKEANSGNDPFKYALGFGDGNWRIRIARKDHIQSCALRHAIHEAKKRERSPCSPEVETDQKKNEEASPEYRYVSKTETPKAQNLVQEK